MGIAAPGGMVSVPMLKAAPDVRGSTLMTISPGTGGPSFRTSP
jgi:hypothetical protein